MAVTAERWRLVGFYAACVAVGLVGGLAIGYGLAWALDATAASAS